MFTSSNDVPPTHDPNWPFWLWVLLCAFLMGLVLGSRPQAAERCITLRVNPALMLRRGPIDVQTHIRGHADHRAFMVAWSSDTGSEGSSGPTSLFGEQSNTVFDLPLRDQPAGNYVFIARVFDGAGHLLGEDRKEIHQPESEPDR